LIDSKTLKVNTMQDSSFNELVGEYTQHIRDLLDDQFDFFESKLRLVLSLPPYEVEVQDGGYVVFDLKGKYQFQFERDREEIARLLHREAQKAGLGGCYFIGKTNTLRVFAH